MKNKPIPGHRNRAIAMMLVVALIMELALGQAPIVRADDSTTFTLHMTGTYGQTEARKMLAQINAFRTGDDAWYWNKDDSTKTTCNDLKELVYDYDLEAAAMQRAMEVALTFEHDRPNGTSCSTAYSWELFRGENIAAGYGSCETASDAFTEWAEESEKYNGQGHRRNMLSENFTRIGIGHVIYNGTHYWVQEFSGGSATAASTAAVDDDRTVGVEVLLSKATVKTVKNPEGISLKQGEGLELPEIAVEITLPNTWPSSNRAGTVAGAWSVADSTIASIKDGQVTALKGGKTTLNCTVTLDKEYQLTAELEVVSSEQTEDPVAVTGITLDKSTLSLEVGSTGQLVATVAPANATDKTYSFASSDDNIVTVSGAGLVTAVGAGTATVTVTTKDGSYSAECICTVTAKQEPTNPEPTDPEPTDPEPTDPEPVTPKPEESIAVTGIQLDKNSLSLKTGGTGQLVATVSPDNATDKTYSFASSNESIVTVSDTGLVTAVGAGTATVTVTTKDGKYSAKCDCTVTAKQESTQDSVSTDTYTLHMTGTYGQTEARKMLEQINSFRTGDDAWYWNSDDSTKTTCTGLKELVYDYDLEAAAMQRAMEIALAYSHTRPNGTSCFTAMKWTSMCGENIAAGYSTASSVFTGWAEANEKYSGQGHRRNMLESGFTRVGIGHVTYNGTHYWVQEFSGGSATTTSTTAADDEKTVAIEVLRANTTVKAVKDPVGISLKQGESQDLPEIAVEIQLPETWPSSKRAGTVAGTWSVADSTIARIENGRITALKGGKTTLTCNVTLDKEYSLKATLEVASSGTPVSSDPEIVSAPEEKITVDPVNQENTTKEGEKVTVSASASYVNAASYTGKKISPESSLKAQTKLTTQVQNTSYQGVVTAAYVSRNNKNAYVDGSEGYNAKNRPYFYMKLKFSGKAATAAGLSKQEITAVKKAVSQLNKELKKEKYYYNINPHVLSSQKVQIKATLNKTGELKLNKKGQLTGIKFVKYQDADGNWKKLTKKDYEIVSVDAAKKTVVLQGKGNMTGRVSLSVMTQ